MVKGPSGSVRIKDLYDKLMQAADAGKLVGDDRIIVSLDKTELWALAISLAGLANRFPEFKVGEEMAEKVGQNFNLEWTLHIES